MNPAAGTLLVAAPELLDPNFAGAVVLLLDVDDNGALGVVLNHPTLVPLAQVWPSWCDQVSEPPIFFSGGPVSAETALAVGRLKDLAAAPAGWRPAYGDIGLFDPDLQLDVLAPELSGLRVFAGYAGWDADQLAGEIAEGSWYVVASKPGDLFCPDVENLRRDVLRRQPGDRAWTSTRPADPSAN